MKSSRRFIARWASPWIICAATATAANSVAAAGGDLRCHVDPATELHLCYKAAELRSVGEWRRSPLYRGGPGAIRPSGHSVEAHCASGRVRLRDRDNVIYEDRVPAAGTAAADVARWMCAERR